MNFSSFKERYLVRCSVKVDHELFNVIASHNVDFDKIALYVKSIGHREYIKTVYWKAISSKFRHGSKCKKCGTKDKLQCHHLTYDHIGMEFLYPEDIMVLCDSCHKEVHKINDKSKKKPLSEKQFKKLISMCLQFNERNILKRVKKGKVSKKEANIIMNEFLGRY